MRQSFWVFQPCFDPKKDGFTNLKLNYTWQHDSLTKLGFIKSTSPTHVIFKTMQITRCKHGKVNTKSNAPKMQFKNDRIFYINT
jgi:hypothetical protein